MTDAAYRIWQRIVLKKIIAAEFYPMVSANVSDLDTSYDNRHNFGAIIDGVLEILSEDNEGINIGCRIDDLIRSKLPNLFKLRNSGFKNFNKCRVQITDATVFSRSEIDLTEDEVLSSLGKLSSVRYETLAYIKSGAARGPNFGSVTELCYEQIGKMNEIIASVIGDDPSCLDPGYYSNMFR